MTGGDAVEDDRDLGALTVRLDFDDGAERAVRVLRLGAAALVLVGAILILSGDPGSIGWVVALVGLGAAVGWAVAFARSLRRTAARDQAFLEVRQRGLVLADGPHRHQIPWTDVKEVEVDEDRLVVRISKGTEPPVIVEPRYRRVGVYDLCETIRRGWLGASGSTDA